ncbi:MAG: sulfite exporter TauE/SafE family protein [Thiocapsa sp.]|nr:sulfite exporter TauE/SafE family protein [Thiocapsa sp.]MCG6896410.1 sulfite exporter TauE/SafE family protein [Thiocapsa sp.]
MSPAYSLAFVVGLLSAMHCIGMCGGIAGALSYSLPAEMRNRPRQLGIFVLAFNLGRIGSYALAGGVTGALGGALFELSGHSLPFEAMRWLAAAVLVGIGLYIGGWFPRFVLIERLGAPFWRRLEPVGRRLLPVTTLPRAALFGMIWGWLPCGLVYSMLLSSPAQGGAWAGAIYMALFGAGTLPVLVAGGVFAGRLYRLGQDRRFQVAAGIAVMLLGLLTLNTHGYNATG